MSIISQYNRFKRTIKAAYELGKAGNMYMIFDQIAVSVYEGSERNTYVKCYVDDRVVLANTGVDDVPCAVFIPASGLIVINQKAKEAPTKILQAIVLHELGHLESKHKIDGVLGKLKYQFTLAIGKGIGMDMEYEADRYAQLCGADMYGLLKMYQSHPDLNTKAVRNRIQYLEDSCGCWNQKEEWIDKG